MIITYYIHQIILFTCIKYFIAANGTVAHYGGGLSDDALSLSVRIQSK